MAQIKVPLVNSTSYETPMYYSHLTHMNGLPSDKVYTLIQNFQGYVWIGTDNGLARYNGLDVKVYNHIIDDSTSILDNIVKSIKEMRDSSIWIGTMDGISIYNPFTGLFRDFSYYYKGNKYFPGKEIVSFFQDDDGSIWIGSENGLVHASENAGKFDLHLINGSGANNIRENSFKYISGIRQDPRDKTKLLLATMGGLLQFDKNTKKITKDYKKTINEFAGITDMLLDQNRYLYTCGWGMGLNCFDLETEQWQEFPADKKRPIDIIHIQPKNKDEIWLATIGNGLGVFNKTTHEFIFYKKSEKIENSLLSDNIINLNFIGSEKNMWLSSDDGINILKKDFFSYRQFKLPNSALFASTFYKDKEDDKLYIGMSEGLGLYVFDERTAVWSCVVPENNQNNGKISIVKIFKDSLARLWISTTTNLYYLDSKGSKLKLFKTNNGKTLELEYPWTTCLLEDNNQNIWVGTRIGTVAKIDSSLKFATYFIHDKNNPNSLIEGTRTSSLYLDRYNRIWIGNNNGISIYDPEKKMFFNGIMDSLLNFGISRRWINGIKEDKYGRIWVAIDAAGLVRIEMKSKDQFKFKLFNTTNGLNSSIIGNIYLDKNKEFWFLNYGLLHFNPYTESSKLYDISNGLHENINFDKSIYIDPDNNIYFGSHGKFETYNLNDFKYLPNDIRLLLESVEINGQNFIKDYGKEKNKLLKLKAGQNNITFHYEAICFQDAVQIKFRYKLDGFDKDWILAGNNKDAKYTNLPAGDYTFNLQVMNRGVWLTQQVSIKIIIPPYFYKTFWFIGLVIISFLLIIYFIFSYRVRQLLKLERLRTRIATDIHDEVGSTLSSISILSEIAGKQLANTKSSEILTEIHNGATSVLEKIDDIIWLVYPKNDKFSNLELRIHEFAVPLFESKGIQFSIHFDKNLFLLRLPMEVRRDVYLIAKEIINNLIKHSGCSKASIIFKEQSSGFLMEIEDNGKGFDMEVSTSRNGLSNIKRRAKQFGAELSINSDQGQGTKITLKVKTI